MKKISFVLRLVFWYLFMSKVFSNDFWDHAMKTHYDQRVSLFNTMKIKDGSVIMLGNSITASCNWSELFGVDNVKKSSKYDEDEKFSYLEWYYNNIALADYKD